MNNKSLLKIILASCLLAGCLFISHPASASQVYKNISNINQQDVNSINYQYHSAQKRDLRVVHKGTPIYHQPYQPVAVPFGQIKHTQLVHLQVEARAKQYSSFYRINYLNHDIGWVNGRNLYKPKAYVLPYRYISQFWPSKAADACEIASLKMALSAVGKANNVSLRRMVKETPRSKNPNKGYTKTPYVYGSGATIYPRALAKVARHYGVKSYPINYASRKKLEYFIKHGDPVVFEGSYMMRTMKSDHSLVLLGYKPHYFYFADPFSKKRGRKLRGWSKINKFMHIFKSKKHGGRAIVIIPKR